jgi:predicted metal-dependent enzyme (double-stranded beta helix superfamily)
LISLRKIGFVFDYFYRIFQPAGSMKQAVEARSMTDKAIADFVTELKSVAAAGDQAPAAVMARVAPLMRRLAADTSWVKPEHYETDEAQGFGITVLNEELDNTFLIEVICWAPGRGVAPHDHQTWGMVIGIDGEEINVDWARNDDGSKPGFADIETARETKVTNGVLACFEPNDIHSVRNASEKPSVSLHVYGRALASVQRSEFDPINKVQRPCPLRKRKTA